jgi:hypothetical protein
MTFANACLLWGVAILELVAPHSDGQQLRAAERQVSRNSAAVEFHIPAVWEYSRPLISPENRKDNPSHAQKDPSVVFHDGQAAGTVCN